MRFALVSPRLAIQKGDFLGSGVPYWPLELVTLAAFLRERGEEVEVHDLFGMGPTRLEDVGDHYLQGVSIDVALKQARIVSPEIFILYAISYMSHAELLEMVKWIRHSYTGSKICVLENSQAVTAYSLQRVAKDFLGAGADYMLCGEAYFNWEEIRALLCRSVGATIPVNVIAEPGQMTVQRLYGKSARYPVPAWDLIDLSGYWNLPYSHGPKKKRYLPLLTSRGCPYPCDFCVVPETNGRRWRGNTPEDVVAEILYLRDRFGVRDFQVEDLNPTVQAKRWESICNLLIERDAGIRFYFVSGTKAETVPVGLIPLYARAGLRYLSISPESGSADLMKVIGKPFDYEHGVLLIAECRRFGIRTQACFVIGHPGETDESLDASAGYLKRLIRVGLDEVAVFVIAPFAGSALHAANTISSNGESLVSFSPKGRTNYEKLEAARKRLIKCFFVGKLKKGLDLWAQGIRAVLGDPQTKMENLPRRVLYIYKCIFCMWVDSKRKKHAS